MKTATVLAVLFTVLIWHGSLQAQSDHPPRLDELRMAVPTGHTGAVLRLAWSPDGSFLASLGDVSPGDGSVKVWQASSGRMIADLGSMTVRSLAWSPDGTSIAVAGSEGALVWDTKVGRFKPGFHHPVGSQAVAWSPDGKYLAVLSEDGVTVYESGTWRKASFLEADRGARAPILWRPKGHVLATGSTLWEMPNGQAIARLENYQRDLFHQNPSAWSPDGTLIAAASGNDLRVWDAESGRLLAEAHHSSAIQCLAFSPDGSRILTGSLTALVWNVKSHADARGDSLPLTIEKEMRGFSSWVSAVAWSPSGELCAAGGSDGVAYTWDCRTWRVAAELKGHRAEINDLAWSPGGTSLASASSDRSSILWNPRSSAPIAVLKAETGALAALAISPNGNFIASGGMESPVRIWEVASGQVINQLTMPKRIDASLQEMWKIPAIAELMKKPLPVFDIAALAWSPDSRQLGVVSSRDGGIAEIWEPQGGTLIRHWSLRTSRPRCLAWSPNGLYLAIGGESEARGRCATTIWRVPSGEIYREIDCQFSSDAPVSVRSLQWSSDGEYLARGGTNISNVVWDVHRNTAAKDFRGAGAVAWSGDDSLLAVGTTVWDYETGLSRVALKREMTGTRIWGASLEQVFGMVRLDPDDLTSLGFAPNRRFLAAATRNTIRVWDVRSGEQHAALAGHMSTVSGLAWTPDGGFLISAANDGLIKVWDASRWELRATLIVVGDGKDWIVTTPNGYFDGSPEAWNLLGWHANPSDFLQVDPVEKYFGEFYYPGLLPAILAGKFPTAVRGIPELDRRQARVSLSLASDVNPSGPIDTRRVEVVVFVGEQRPDKDHRTGSGVRDVRLFRNGSLVKTWRGDVLREHISEVRLTTDLPIIAGENRLTAYAFNRDNIKSADATLIVTGVPSLRQPGTAYIVAIGINQYSNPDYDLNYAVADAQVFAEELRRQLTTLGNFRRVEVIPLLNKDATRANILQAFARLAGREEGAPPTRTPEALYRLNRAQPEDALFVYFAGHGTAAGARFYLIPHDLGYTGGREAIDSKALKKIFGNSISDLDLEQAFENIDAGRALLVIDACNSGQALESDEKRQGPMNSKGLAQLAYEKGMYVLAAAQGYQAAQEVTELGHGLLTYALVEEGLKSGAADVAPNDGQVVLREWLDFATVRVPRMQQAVMQEARKVGRDLAFVEGEKAIKDLDRRSLQRPRVFYRREPESIPLVVARPGSRKK
jgi:WD40 repeat protein/uncharacterized caspase-like protein